MKIAYIVPYVPNLIRTRPYNLINQLVNLEHEVIVFTLGSGMQDREDVEFLRSRVPRVYYQEQPTWYSLWNSLKVVPSRRPLQTVYSWNPQLAKELIGCLGVPGSFDIVHVEHLRGSLYGQFIKSNLPHIPVVWDSVDCISYLFEQASKQGRGGFGKFVTRFELNRTRQMEAKLVRKFEHVLVSSEVDKKALLDLNPSSSNPVSISVLSNGVDLEFFHPNPDIQRDQETLIFSGKMSYHANISMVMYLVSEIMPRIWKKRPTTRLYIVGKDPSGNIKELEKNSLIKVTGTVDDIRPFLWRATVSVVPLLYGAGIQNKILEAMATRTPVVTTSRALSALQAQAGKELLIGDNPDDFSAAILRLIENSDLQYEIGQAGEAYTKKHHSWESMATELANIYNKTYSICNFK